MDPMSLVRAIGDLDLYLPIAQPQMNAAMNVIDSKARSLITQGDHR